MKKFLYIAVIGMVIWSCGGGGDDPPPTPENKAPSTPIQVYPANNDLCIDNAVNFQWNASTDPNTGDAISYIVDVSKTSSFSTIIATKTVSTLSTSISLEKGIAFYWRITAKDNKGLSSPVSAANGFYTEGDGVSNYVPFSPELIAPGLGTTVQSATANLQWNASDVDNDALTYDVHFGKTNPPTIAASNLTTKSYTTATLDASSTYYWKIVVKDGKGGQTIGQVWNFKTD